MVIGTALRASMTISVSLVTVMFGSVKRLTFSSCGALFSTNECSR
jgi:hypothetical protein